MKITISRKQSFLICDESGDVIPGTEQGLYSLDTRFLSAYQLYINGVKPNTLTGKEVGFYSSVHYLAVPALNGIKPETVIVARDRYVDDNGLHENLRINNYNNFPISMELLLRIDNDFADIFEVKAISRPSKLRPRFRVGPREITISYRLKDVKRATKIVFSKPFEFNDKICLFRIELSAKDSWDCSIDFQTLTNALLKTVFEPMNRKFLRKQASKPAPSEISENWIDNTASFESNYSTLQEAFYQSKLDLAALRLTDFAGAGEIPAAGIPWYTTAFGRDSIIASYQSLLVQPALAEGTLKVMARFQGKKNDKYTEEQPGRIIHEIRFGRLAAQKTIPHAHYYGTIDATPLFVILAEQYYRLTGNLDLIKMLKNNIYAALDWLDKYGDLDGDGFIEYHKTNPKGITNQGWKDSGEAVNFADGRMAETPIALVEVQGYAYSAKKRGANLARILGDTKKADALESQAKELKEKFNKAFWMEDKGYFCLGLDKDKKQIDSITSNGAHVLWTRIADVEKAEAVAERILQSDMFSGWGIRTLSTEDAAYNPVSYHNGSVWPHDNSIIMVGLLKYGLEKEAAQILSALVDASRHFPKRRLPELFCGFDKEQTAIPINYPTSSSPQAWAAAAIPYMTLSLLRARPDFDNKKITIAPFLLNKINWSFYGGIKFFDEEISIKVNRTDSGPLTSVTEKPDWLKVEEIT